MPKTSGPLGFLGKKNFHPSSFRNAQRVYEAEREVLAARRAEVERELVVKAESRDAAHATGDRGTGSARQGRMPFMVEGGGAGRQRKRPRSPALSHDPDHDPDPDPDHDHDSALGSRRGSTLSDTGRCGRRSYADGDVGGPFQDDEGGDDAATAAFRSRWLRPSGEQDAAARHGAGRADRDARVPGSASMAAAPAAPLARTSPSGSRSAGRAGRGRARPSAAVILREDPMLALHDPSSQVVNPLPEPSRRPPVTGSRTPAAAPRPDDVDEVEEALNWKAAVDRARSKAAEAGLGSLGLAEARSRSVPTVKPLRLRASAAAALGILPSGRRPLLLRRPAEPSCMAEPGSRLKGRGQRGDRSPTTLLAMAADAVSRGPGAEEALLAALSEVERRTLENALG